MKDSAFKKTALFIVLLPLSIFFCALAIIYELASPKERCKRKQMNEYRFKCSFRLFVDQLIYPEEHVEDVAQ